MKKRYLGLFISINLSFSCVCPMPDPLKNKVENLKENLIGLGKKLNSLKGKLEDLKSNLNLKDLDQWPLKKSLSTWARDLNLTLIHFKSLQQHNSWICGYYAMYNAKFITDKILEAYDKNLDIVTFLNHSLQSEAYKNNFNDFQKRLTEEVYGVENIQKFQNFYVPKFSVEKNSVNTGKAMLPIIKVDLTHDETFSEDEFRKKFNENYSQQFLNLSDDFKIGNVIICTIAFSNDSLGLFLTDDIDSAVSSGQFTKENDKIFLNKLIKRFGEIKGKSFSIALGFLNAHFKKNPEQADINKICDILIEMKKEKKSESEFKTTLDEILSKGKIDFSSGKVLTNNSKDLSVKLRAIINIADFDFLGVVRLGDEHFVMVTLINPGKNKSKIIIIMDSFNTKVENVLYEKHIEKPVKELARMAGLTKF